MSEASKGAIDAAGIRYSKGEESLGDLEIIREYRQFRCSGLIELFQQIAAAIEPEPCVLSCRVKRANSILRKLRRESSMKLTRMEDIIGFRIIAPSLSSQHHIAMVLATKIEIKKIRDYASAPNPLGYRAIHLAVMQKLRHTEDEEPNLHPCEIQLRTYFQHIWATTSESFGEQAKEGGGTREERGYLTELSKKIESVENDNPDLVQIEKLKIMTDTQFTVIVFNKETGYSAIKEEYGTRLEAAVQRMLYLEELHRSDLSHETVLIGVPTEEAKITHMRYFRYRGIPELPEIIRPTLARPQSAANGLAQEMTGAV